MVIWWLVGVFDSIEYEAVSPLYENDFWVWWVFMGFNIGYFVMGFVGFWLVLINNELLEDLGADAVKWLAQNNDWMWNEDKATNLEILAWF